MGKWTNEKLGWLIVYVLSYSITLHFTDKIGNAFLFLLLLLYRIHKCIYTIYLPLPLALVLSTITFFHWSSSFISLFFYYTCSIVKYNKNSFQPYHTDTIRSDSDAISHTQCKRNIVKSKLMFDACLQYMNHEHSIEKTEQRYPKATIVLSIEMYTGINFKVM